RSASCVQCHSADRRERSILRPCSLILTLVENARRIGSDWNIAELNCSLTISRECPCCCVGEGDCYRGSLNRIAKLIDNFDGRRICAHPDNGRGSTRGEVKGYGDKQRSLVAFPSRRRNCPGGCGQPLTRIGRGCNTRTCARQYDRRWTWNQWLPCSIFEGQSIRELLIELGSEGPSIQWPCVVKEHGRSLHHQSRGPLQTRMDPFVPNITCSRRR